VPTGLSGSPGGAIQRRAGVRGAVGGQPGDFDGEAIVEGAGNRTADDSDADKSPVLGPGSEGELVSLRALVVAVDAVDVGARISEGNWYDGDPHLSGTNLMRWHS
jgi:hypothetical protein